MVEKRWSAKEKLVIALATLLFLAIWLGPIIYVYKPWLSVTQSLLSLVWTIIVLVALWPSVNIGGFIFMIFMMGTLVWEARNLASILVAAGILGAYIVLMFVGFAIFGAKSGRID